MKSFVSSERYRNTALYVTEYCFEVPSANTDAPVRIAVLADLHDRVYGCSLRKLAAAIVSYSPDVILSAGDLIAAKKGNARTGNALALVRFLASRYPVFLIDGNHERRLLEQKERYGTCYQAYSEKLRKYGAVCLNNEDVLLDIRGMRLRITGFVQTLDKFNRIKARHITKNDIEQAVGKCRKDAWQILLAHNPDHFSAYAGWGADLTLSGHLHGGMIRLPLLGGVLGSGLIPFPAYDRGAFTFNAGGKKRHMVVSAGLGAHTIPVRINNPPELVILKLNPGS